MAQTRLAWPVHSMIATPGGCHLLAPQNLEKHTSGDAYARELFPDLFQGHISTVSHFLNQPECNRMAKFLTWIRMLHMNKAQCDGSVPAPKQT